MLKCFWLLLCSNSLASIMLEMLATFDKRLFHFMADEHPVETEGASNLACSINWKQLEEATATLSINKN